MNFLTFFEENLQKSINNYPKNIHLPFAQKELLKVFSYAFLKGKRIRPMLVMSSSLSIKSSWKKDQLIKLALPAALAIEYLHTYSLIHDDLPAMDNDDFRRGRLSAHRYFNEGVAILAGDALLIEAFFILSKAKINPALQCQKLAESSGKLGMILGQLADLKAQKENAHKKDWPIINSLKTAKLFECASILGGLSVNASPQEIEVLSLMGHKFGEAFQLKDDLDDEKGIFNTLGKEQINAQIKDIYNNIKNLGQKLSNEEIIRLFEQVFYPNMGS